LRPPHRSPRPALPHVEHLHPDCRLAVFDEIPISHLIRPSFRHASKERFEAGPHLPKLTNGYMRSCICANKIIPWYDLIGHLIGKGMILFGGARGGP
jgi:hypothetical protein